MRGNSHAELMGIGTLVSALQLVTGKLLGVFGSGGERRLVTATATIGIRAPAPTSRPNPRAPTFACATVRPMLPQRWAERANLQHASS